MSLLKYALRRIQAKPPLVWVRWMVQSPYSRPHRVLGARLGKCAMPDFLIIGTQRAGTTSLYRYLTNHPEVKAALKKEVHFFDLNYDRGLRWYSAYFPIRGETRRFKTGEASPYYLFHPDVAGRVARDLPGAKLVAMLRNPVERAYSQYHHEVRRGNERRSFEEAIAREENAIVGGARPYGNDADYSADTTRHHSYLSRGIYADQLEHWLQYFQRDQLLLLKSEEFFVNPGEGLERTLEFLGLAGWAPAKLGQHNVGRYKGIGEEVRKRLARFFAPHNERLASITGWNIDDWD